ncbi:MAG: twin-arginine translocase TatA/TatE family subunit [Myxococcota bacterium]|nr:twin-arginine translocase TatA/TatE family subunit [Myxococcota bacterium]
MLAFFQMSGPWEWIIVLVVVLIFFGAGKLPQVLSQMGKGVRAFKDGMKEEDETKSIEAQSSSMQDDVKVSEAEEVHKS